MTIPTPTTIPTPPPSIDATGQGRHNGQIAFGVRAADGSSNIFSELPDGTGRRQLTSGPGNHLCAAYSADGKEIAYCADVSGSFEIWTMKPDGTKQEQLTRLGGRALFPDVSRDGTRVAFGGIEGADPHTEIYVVDAATGKKLVALTSCAKLAQGCYNDYPAWSPDGRQIVFIHADDVDANGNAINAQVWVMNVDGSNQRPLTTDAAPKDQVPDWSPDGSMIAYSSGAAQSEGIDTIYLDRWMRESGLAELLPSLDLVYVGLSAGSLVMSPSVADVFASWTRPAGGEGLGFVDFVIFPHLDNPALPENTTADAERWAAGLTGPGYAIDDETAIMVVDGVAEVISEGHWRLFGS
jgi:hypothetical protein